MITFQKYFENKVENLLKTCTQQTFFVFRGFGIEQINYLINHPNSILKNENLIIGKNLDLRELESSKKKLNKGLLLSDRKSVV